MNLQFRALAFIAEHPRSRTLVTDLSRALNITRPQAVCLLYGLTTQKLLRRAGPLIGGRWEVVPPELWAPTQPMEANEPDRT